MRITTKLILTASMSLALAISVATVSFASDCASAEVLKVGAYAGIGGGVASDNVIAVKCLSDTSWGTYTQFYPNTAIADQALATALTAMSLGKKVWIRTSAKTSGSILHVIYINN